MGTRYPKISIVTPSYNQGKYLEQTIQSVLSQGYPNLEYIIIDGGSTDNSVEIIKRYASQLHYWVSEPDEGMYHAIQKGFDRSSGDIMAWINSDDLYHRQALWSVARLFNQFPKVDWIMGKNTFFDEQSTAMVYPDDFWEECWSPWAFYLLPKGRFIQQESTFWRRSLWDKAGAYINTTYQLAGDFELWARFFRHAPLFSTNMLLGGFRQRSSNQKSKDHFEEYMEEAREVILRELQNPVIARTLARKKRKLAAIRLVPFRKKKLNLRKKVLELPPKIEYEPNDKYTLRQI